MVNYNSWLGEVSDDTKISKLSVPGTHNSAACHTALPSVQCQGASITDQLDHGIRFLDFRVGHNLVGNDLTVVHGNFPVKIPFPLKFTDALNEVYGFLDRNPRETVIVSIKQEGSGTWEGDQFPNAIWDQHISQRKDKWYLGTSLPRLSEARGKAILFRRFGVNDQNRRNELGGIEATGWSYNTADDDRGAFNVQDFCEVKSTDDLPKKIDCVKRMLDKASSYNQTNDDKLFLNFTSGSNFFDAQVWPQPVARAMMSGGVDGAFKKGCGVVVLDYAEEDNWKMPRVLVDSNFR